MNNSLVDCGFLRATHLKIAILRTHRSDDRDCDPAPFEVVLPFHRRFIVSSVACAKNRAEILQAVRCTVPEFQYVPPCVHSYRPKQRPGVLDGWCCDCSNRLQQH